MNVSARIHSGFNPATTATHAAMRPNDDVADMHQPEMEQTEIGMKRLEGDGRGIGATSAKLQLISNIIGSMDEAGRTIVEKLGGGGGGRKEPTKPKPMVEPHGVAHNTGLDSTPRWIAV